MKLPAGWRQLLPMSRSTLLIAGLLSLCASSLSCTDPVGPCTGADQGRTRALVGGVTMYAGQAIVNAACSTGCHASSAVGEGRRGVPAELDFDLLPVDEGDAVGTRTNKRGETVLKLRSEQVAALRARQQKIVEERDAMWAQLKQKLMPPDGMFESLLSRIHVIRAGTDCEAGKAYSQLSAGRARETVRNWLACGAPLVESNGVAVDKSRSTGSAGAVGNQYPVCEPAADNGVSPTLETLFAGSLSSCKSCHPALSSPDLNTVEKASATLASKRPVCGDKPYVTPGDPDMSFFLDILKAPSAECKHKRMPLGGPYLSATDLQEVSRWIAAGAPTRAAEAMTPDDRDDEATDEGGLDPADGDSGAQSSRVDAGTASSARDGGRDAGHDGGKDAGR